MCQNNIANAVHIFQGQVGVKRQGQHTLGNAAGHRRLIDIILFVETGKRVAQRVEVFARTDPLTGVCVMLTGCDSDGVQCAEFGSSEGILREKVTFGAPSAPEKDDYIIIFDVLFKSGIMSSRKAIYEAHMLCDGFIQPFREILRGFKGELCTERHDYTDSIKDGRKNIVLLKQVAAQGAMYDTYVFPKEPSGALGGMSVIDLGSMPIVLTANEYRDGALRSMQ